MPTTKKRLNITLSKQMQTALELLATRDNVPEATKAVELLDAAITQEEERILLEIATERDTPDATYIDEDTFWKRVGITTK
jgi:hypothetical protein